MKLTGAEIVLACLKDEGVEFLFGYPGGAALHIYDAVYQQEQVRHILVRHEQGATHAADGFARATGKPGVVLVTSGPGVTNTVTGIAPAFMDSIPMVVLTAQVPTHLIGDDAFQEVDTVGITRPCVKHNFLVKDVNELAMTIKKAFYIATTGRPGPVVVDIPKDVTAARAEYQYPKSIQMRSYAPVQKGHTKQISRAVELLLQAERPIIYTGGGVIHGGAASELCELVRELKYPCTNTLMGLGAFPASDPLFIGMLGMHGNYGPNVNLVEYVKMNLSDEDGQKQFADYNKMCIDRGFEGIMVKPVNGIYECKRSTLWLKVKPFIEVSLTVKATEEGTGRNVGKLGALIVEGKDSGKFIKTNVGSGLSDTDREVYWKYMNKVVGQIVEVRADAITQNQDAKDEWSLRFPRFLRFRGFEVGEKL